MKLINVSKNYASRAQTNFILDGINLNIPKGKLTAIIGPNGAGKSTLLNLMGQLEMNYHGEIYLDDILLQSWQRDDVAKRIATLKQKQDYDLRISVYDFISFGRFPYTKGKLNAHDHQIIEEVIHYLELEEFQDRYINTLSGGQLQRVAIAMVMAQDTEYILLDEPLNNLDIRQEVHLMNLLNRIVKKLDKRVVIIMHDINMVSQFADYIVALKDGRLFHQGEKEDFIQCQTLESLYDIGVDILDGCGHPVINFYEKELIL